MNKQCDNKAVGSLSGSLCFSALTVLSEIAIFTMKAMARGYADAVACTSRCIDICHARQNEYKSDAKLYVKDDLSIVNVGDNPENLTTSPDVILRSNTFDRCKYGDWGDAVIRFYPRREEEESNEPEMTIHHVRCEDVQEDIKRK